jgi:AAA+ superfamily predicted ATPase
VSHDLLESLRSAVEAAPDDLPLRLHLAHLLAAAGDPAGAVRQAAAILQRDPGHPGAAALIASAATTGPAERDPAGPPASVPAGSSTSNPVAPPTISPAGAPAAGPAADDGDGPAPGDLAAGPIHGGPAVGTPLAPDGPEALSEEEVLRRLDSEFTGVVPPMFIGSDGYEGEVRRARFENPRSDWDTDFGDDEDGDDERGEDEDLMEMLGAFTPEMSSLTLADVAGMDEVKARLEAAVLAPIRNPDLVRLYGKSLRGGLLLYGPPGCGKTFIARALAGEIGARLLTVSLADVLDMYVGASERNLHALFEIARRNAPCVVFLDEIDALGQKRTQLRSSASRGTVNQLLTEMDGLRADNEGVYVLGATNHPWDVDVAFRRPGRFDRMVLVLPPDEKAREAVLRHHLRDRPIAAVDTRALARTTAGYSGADLAYVCESAAERALLDSVRTGRARMIEMPDLEAAVADSRPSIGPWLQTARNVAEFANTDGSYDDLLAYLRSHRSP